MVTRDGAEEETANTTFAEGGAASWKSLQPFPTENARNQY